MNMSYCRFQNTLQDLRDCAENINANLTGEEFEARRYLIELCKDIVDEADDSDFEEMEDIDEYQVDYVPEPYVYTPTVYTQKDLDTAIEKGQKIEAIRAYRQLRSTDEHQVGLREAKETVEAMMGL